MKHSKEVKGFGVQKKGEKMRKNRKIKTEITYELF
jgi:hypothetical protein